MATARMASKESSNHLSKTDWDRVKALKDEDIDFADIPEATDKQLASGTSGRAARLGRPKLAEEERKVGVYIRFSPHVLDSLRASGRNWQARLREYIEKGVASGDI